MKTPIRKYQSSLDFRSAIQDKFKNIAKNEGKDVSTLNRLLAYERFLARIFHKNDINWSLKGGHALELRLQKFRGTKDIDLIIKEGKYFASDKKYQKSAILKKIREQAAIDLSDYFSFTVIDSDSEISNLTYGGYRFVVKAFIGGKLFHAFPIDVGVGDVWIDPQDHIFGEGLVKLSVLKQPSILNSEF